MIVQKIRRLYNLVGFTRRFIALEWKGGAMFFVSGTRLHLRSWRLFLPFFIYSQRSARQARGADGNLHTDLQRDRQAGFWTRTLWS